MKLIEREKIRCVYRTIFSAEVAELKALVNALHIEESTEDFEDRNIYGEIFNRLYSALYAQEGEKITDKIREIKAIPNNYPIANFFETNELRQVSSAIFFINEDIKSKLYPNDPNNYMYLKAIIKHSANLVKQHSFYPAPLMKNTSDIKVLMTEFKKELNLGYAPIGRNLISKKNKDEILMSEYKTELENYKHEFLRFLNLLKSQCNIQDQDSQQKLLCELNKSYYQLSIGKNIDLEPFKMISLGYDNTLTTDEISMHAIKFRTAIICLQNSYAKTYKDALFALKDAGRIARDEVYEIFKKVPEMSHGFLNYVAIKYLANNHTDIVEKGR